MKLLCHLLILLLLLSAPSQYAQSDIINSKSEGKGKRRKWKKSGTSYNPYLRKKARNKPSAKLARQEKKELKRQRRKYRRDLRRSGRGHRKGPKP